MFAGTLVSIRNEHIKYRAYYAQIQAAYNYIVFNFLDNMPFCTANTKTIYKNIQAADILIFRS